MLFSTHHAHLRQLEEQKSDWAAAHANSQAALSDREARYGALESEYRYEKRERELLIGKFDELAEANRTLEEQLATCKVSSAAHHIRALRALRTLRAR